MTATRTAVTGATGEVGGRIARILADQGVEQRLLVRTPANAPALTGARPVRSSYTDPGDSLEGIEVLFMVSLTESVDRLDHHLAFIDAATAAGVRHIVYTSFLSAAPDAVFTLARDHWWTEERIRESGMTFTILRDSFYLDFLDSLPGPDGIIRGPAGEGRVSAVARADVARAAAAVLADPGRHENAVYTLTGPEALTMRQLAGILTQERGSAVGYVDETVQEAYRSRQQYSAPAWQLDAWVTTYTAIAVGALSLVTDDVTQITGQPPLSLRALLADRKEQ